MGGVYSGFTHDNRKRQDIYSPMLVLHKLNMSFETIKKTFYYKFVCETVMGKKKVICRVKY